MNRIATILVLLGLAMTVQASGTTQLPIQGYGPFVEVPDRGFRLPEGMNMKAVFDVRNTGRSTERPNPGIESAARLLNMHAAAGKPASEWAIAVVIHGQATRDILKDSVYQERFGVANPNLPLIRALKKAGVQFYVCGQSLHYSGWSAHDMADPKDLAMSAMTALTYLQNRGYALLPQ
jgi:intracellular sulfur oxidation DsrE/DsrF family protein